MSHSPRIALSKSSRARQSANAVERTDLPHPARAIMPRADVWTFPLEPSFPCCRMVGHSSL